MPLSGDMAQKLLLGGEGVTGRPGDAAVLIVFDLPRAAKLPALSV